MVSSPTCLCDSFILLCYFFSFNTQINFCIYEVSLVHVYCAYFTPEFLAILYHFISPLTRIRTDNATEQCYTIMEPLAMEKF